MNDLSTVQKTNNSMQVLDSFSHGLDQFLTKIGLPNENVLVPIPERAKVINNLPDTLNQIQNYNQTDALYLSKMVAACTVGLFDAALNYLWDETVENLRKKVSLFDLQYFYATAVSDENQRKQFKDEDDLKKLTDAKLIKGCFDVGLISEITYKHLDYIRDMRNYASAAHPNQNDITGLQLASHIETCLKEVLAKDLDGSLIEIKRLLKNVREQIFTKETAAPVCSAIQQLPKDRLLSVARSVFGMYFNPACGTNTKNNILLLANSIWISIDEQTKKDFGLKYASFSVNGETDKAQSVRDLLQYVNGLSYLDDNTRAVDIQDILERLLIAHDGYDNFYTEGPLAKTLCQFISQDGIVPGSIRNNYVKTIAICFMGNSHGVSWDAEPLYKRLITTWKDRETLLVCKLLKDVEFSSRMQFQKCFARFISLLGILKNNISNLVLLELVSYLEKCSNSTLASITTDSRFTNYLNGISL